MKNFKLINNGKLMEWKIFKMIDNYKFFDKDINRTMNN